jgi:hypothetical protein
MPSVNKFFKKGQNTPLTCVFGTGGEDNDTASDGIASSTGGSYASSSPAPHQNAGNGSQLYRNLTASNAADSFLGTTDLREFIIATAVYTTAISEQEWRARESAGPSTQVSLNIISGTGVLSAKRGATTIGSSAGGSVPIDQWNWHHSWIYIDNSAGFVRHRIGAYSNLVLDTGALDTQAHATINYANQMQMAHPAGAAGTCKYDEFLLFARSLYWSSGSGTLPVAGDTITGSSSGATAIVTHAFSDSTDGAFFVRTVAGAFIAGETITSSGWSGAAGNTLSNTEADLWVPEVYGFNRPLSSDLQKEWTNTTNASGDHFPELADASTATFVSTSTIDQTDIFGTSGTLPPGAAIKVLIAKVYARASGISASDEILLGIDDGSGAVDLAENSPLSGSYEAHMAIATHNPNTGEEFSTTEIGNLQLRLTSK